MKENDRGDFLNDISLGTERKREREERGRKRKAEKGRASSQDRGQSITTLPFGASHRALKIMTKLTVL